MKCNEYIMVGRLKQVKEELTDKLILETCISIINRVRDFDTDALSLRDRIQLLGIESQLTGITVRHAQEQQ